MKGKSMDFIKRTTLLIASLLVMGTLLTPMQAFAETNAQAACRGLEITGGKCGDELPGETGINSVIKTVINILSVAVGVVSVIMIIIGGLKYVISSGDSSNINSAKNTILYAIIGLVIVALAQIIVKFTLNSVTKTPPKCSATVKTNCTP